ncbi:MAG: nucleotidyltransferase [Candidatus Aminicenantes bacterium]|nr:nucleotidyltransferase [Candidatus Aminicenantes bacterium]
MESAGDLKTLLKEVCTQLKKKELQFCLAGGWAVSIIGTARTTIDIDILIVLNDDIKKLVISILEDSFHLIQSHENEMKFKTLSIWRNIVSLQKKGELFMIDFLIADTDYLKSIVERKIEIDYEGISIPVIPVEDLIILKLSSFRKQDEVDIENLLHSASPIDWEYLENTIKKLLLNWDYIEKIKNPAGGQTFEKV